MHITRNGPPEGFALDMAYPLPFLSMERDSHLVMNEDMGKIDIERRPTRILMPLLLTLVVIALIAIGVVVYVEGRRAAQDRAQPAATPDTLARPPSGL